MNIKTRVVRLEEAIARRRYLEGKDYEAFLCRLTDEELEKLISRDIDCEYYQLFGEGPDPGPPPEDSCYPEQYELTSFTDEELSAELARLNRWLLEEDPDAPYAAKLRRIMELL